LCLDIEMHINWNKKYNNDAKKETHFFLFSKAACYIKNISSDGIKNENE
jgi:1,4-alpha-glucan branching enzyme